MPQRFRSMLMIVTVMASVLITAATARADLDTERVAFGLQRPVWVTAPPGDTTRIFILEQHSGDIEILNLQTGTLNPTPFFTKTNLSTGNEQGLLGMAFHPSYPDSPYFYTNSTRANNDTRIQRYEVSAANPDSADPSSGQLILTISQPQTNHNGGWIAFGPDGYLYIGTGDGGGANDTGTGHDPLIGNGQSLDTLLGKLLRIDVDGRFPYAIPPDNPFVGVAGLNEIWAYGLRNPWRNDFDNLTGELYIGDVGQNQWEEISYQPAGSPGGLNYGWREFEGYAKFNCPNPCDSTGHVRPIHVYSHGGNPFRCSVTGGCVYRGQDIVGFDGTYFFADYCSNQIWSFNYDGSAISNFTDRTAELAPGGGLNIQSITSFGEDAKGEIYICDQSGEVFKIIQDPTSVGDPTAFGTVTLGAAIPNPSRSGFSFRIGLPEASDARVRVFDPSGRVVRTLTESRFGAGSHALEWDGLNDEGTRVGGGVYFLRLDSRNESQTRKLTLIR